MSIDSIGPKINPRTVQPLEESARANQETRKVEIEKPNKQERQDLSDEQKQQAMEGFYSGTSMSTQDFIILRAQAPDETLELADMVKQTSEDNIALQILQKTLEGMDENKNRE